MEGKKERRTSDRLGTSVLAVLLLLCRLCVLSPVPSQFLSSSPLPNPSSASMEPGIRRSRHVPLSSDAAAADGVFKWPSPISSRSTYNPPKPSDYAEIFGGFAASCSIPVLDLPPPAAAEDVFGTTVSLDYLDIFGGFETGGLGVSYEELFFPRENQRDINELEVCEQSTAVNASSKNETKGEKIQFSSSEGKKKLNGGTGELDLSYEKPRNESQENSVNGKTNVARSLNCTAVLSGEGVESNFRNSESPTSLSTSNRSSVDDANSDHKSSETKFSPSEDTSANEQYHSCSSSIQSAVNGNVSSHDQSTIYEYPSANNGGIEENCFGLIKETTSSSGSSKSSKKETAHDEKCSTTFQHLHTHSNSFGNNSTSSMEEGIPNQSVNDLTRDGTVYDRTTNSCNQNSEFIMGKAEKKMPKRSAVPKSSVFMMWNAGNPLKEDQKQDYTTASEDSPVHDQSHERLSSNLSASIDVQSLPNSDAKFVTVSDINLQTQPSQVPPPSRFPPKVCNDQRSAKLRKAESLKIHSDKSDYSQATCRRTNSLIDSSATFKGTGRNGPPQVFGVEMDVSSAAAASVAAMKEAMEQAQARLKSAKETMEKKKDSLQGRKKSVLNEDSKSEKKMDETIQAPLHSEHEIILGISENYPRRNEVTNDHRKKNRGIGSVTSDLETNEKYFDLAEESLWGAKGEDTKEKQISYVKDANAGEWKVEERFFELVNNGNKPTKAQEFHDHEAERIKEKNHFKFNEEKTYEQTTDFVHDLKNSMLLAVDTRENEDRSKCSILLGDRDDTVKESIGVAEVGDREGPKQIPEVSLQENEEIIEGKSCVQQSEQDKESEEQRDHVSVKQKQDVLLDANTVKESEDRLDKSSESCPLDAILENDLEDLKEKSTKDTHLTRQGEGIQSNEENEHVINASNEGPVIIPDERSIVSGREQEPCDTGREEASQHKLCEEESADTILTEKMNSCEHTYNHEEKEPMLQEDVIATMESGWKVSSVQESGKPMESGKRTKDDCNKEQDMGILSAAEESTPYPENNEENKTNEGTCWWYICEKIIRETQVELQQKEEKQKLTKLDDELNAQGNDAVYKDELEVASTSQKNGTYFPSDKGYPNVNEMEQGDFGHTTKLDPPNNMQNASQKVTEEPDRICKHIDESLKPGERATEERMKMDMEQEEERTRKLEEEKEREREKDRLAFERASQEAHDRSIAESWERKERDAVERDNAEARHRALAEAREKAERASNEALLLAEKASQEARLKAERAAVERATAEARERAIERALAEKAMKEARERSGRSHSAYRGKQRKDNTSDILSKELIGQKNISSCSDVKDFSLEQRHSNRSNHGQRPEGESAIRCKARLERHQRTVERAAKALAEKNLRDILVQREQAERNRIAETLDAEIRRWSSGKEGNLRALLSTLQYILGPESGWQPIPLTDVITAAAVKKAYRKATLCVHPDKLQQRGASIQQKYICEKVFDLLKDAWNRFNSEER